MSSLWFRTDLSSQLDVACKFENVSLQSWNLSSRTLNALLRYNFKMTVGEVIRADESFVTIRGLGVAGIKELETKVSQLLTEELGTIKTQSSLDQSTASANLSPSIISFNFLPSVLSEAMQKVPVDQLHLDTMTHNALVEAGIATIGELYNANSSRLRDIRGFHSNSLGGVNHALITLLNSIGIEGEVNWFQYWEAQGIQIFPSSYMPKASIEQIIKELPKIIEAVLRRELDERAWIIIQRRFGLGNAEKLTLEGIGDAFGISRERIRQIEERALRILQNVFVEQHYAGKNYHVHPAAHLLVPRIAQRDTYTSTP